MNTKEYPLDYIQALHLLTGTEPIVIEDRLEDTYVRRGDGVFKKLAQGAGWTTMNFREFLNSGRGLDYRIYSLPEEPEKLEPVELCSELFDIVDDFHAAPSFYRKIYGLLIAQAVRMAREEREAEKNK